MNKAHLRHVAGRVRMGDSRARAEADRILRRAEVAPPGSEARECGRYLARLLGQAAPRAAVLPQPGKAPRTRLAKRLHAIFVRAGGRVQLRAA